MLHVGEAAQPDADAAVALLQELKRRGYGFVTPTPATHARVVARPSRKWARNLRDVLGWSLPFEEGVLDGDMLAILRAANAVLPAADGRLQCQWRVSSLGEDLLLHSAYPTIGEDAVFFGPDSYRFADLIRRELARSAPRAGARLVDVGAGAGAGGMAAVRCRPGLRLTLTDINPAALHLARINAAVAGIDAEFALGADLDGVSGSFDIALANPPYIIDPAGRDYRDGGGMHGSEVSCEMARAALERLTPRGRLILYTGSAIVEGEDQLRAALMRLADEQGCTLRYRQIDPDVFGEELDKPPYRDVERIAVVSAVFVRTG